MLEILPERNMDSKAEAYGELLALVKEYQLAPSTVGRLIANDPSLMERLADPDKDITTTTLDNIWRFIMTKRGQLELDLRKD